MDEVVGNILVGKQLNGSTVAPGLPVVAGVTPQTKGAVMFDGSTNAVDFGYSKDRCLGNIKKCPDGITIAAWIKVGTKASYPNEWYYFTTGGHTQSSHGWAWSQRDGKFNFEARTRKTYRPRVSTIVPFDTWTHIITSWHGVDGVKLYVDFRLVATETQWVRLDSGDQYPNFRAASGHIETLVDNRGNFTVDDVYIWYKKVSSEMIKEIQLRTYL